MAGTDTKNPMRGLEPLTQKIGSLLGNSVVGIIFYGSILREYRGSSEDRDEGLHDLMVVVDDCGKALRNRLSALGCALLPPNVYYLEATENEKTHRSKYAVLSLKQLRRFTAAKCLQSYFWGRLSQPVRVVWRRDDASEEAIKFCLRQAQTTLMRNTQALVNQEFTAKELWTKGLWASYRTEFRAEKKKQRAAEITSQGLAHFRTACLRDASTLGWSHVERGADSKELVFRRTIQRGARTSARVTWWARNLQGRCLHVLRLAKAGLTFQGGIEYLMWKIERHSGVAVELSERTKKHPLIFGWWALWKVRRKGGFR